MLVHCITRAIFLVLIGPLLVGRILASEAAATSLLSEQSYSQIVFARQLIATWYIPKLQNVSGELNQFKTVLNNGCTAREFTLETSKPAQQHWLALARAWAQLTAVSIGPILERRSARLFNYRPTRPELIERALTESPEKLVDLDQVGAPAKGFPAIEWILFNRFKTNSFTTASTLKNSTEKNAMQSCQYTMLLTNELAQELSALQTQFGELSVVLGNRSLDADNAAKTIVTEFINQLVGALDRLHIQQLQVKKNINSQPLFANNTNSLQINQNQWLAVREHMHTSLAGLLKNSTIPAKQTPNDARLVLQFQKQLSALPTSLMLTKALTLQHTQILIETKIADAVGVTIGFSDNDGD
jgi:uncharacterized protein